MEKIYECPWCSIKIMFSAVNCGIARCGIYKDTGEPLPPHMTQTEAEQLGDTIWGCSNPFQIVKGELVRCAWI